MERGELGLDQRPRMVFIFEGLVAWCGNPRLERSAVRRHRYKTALTFWQLDPHVVARLQELQERFDVPVEIITWHPSEFADELRDWLDRRHVPFSDVQAWDYETASPAFAVDPSIQVVYDPDPDHRFGFGFKARSFRDEFKRG